MVSARVADVRIGRVFYFGEGAGKNFALYENADTQPVIDVNTGVQIVEQGKPLSVACAGFGRGAQITDVPAARPGKAAGENPTRVCLRGTKASLQIELIKGERQFIEGELAVTPKLLDRAGAAVASSPLKPVTVPFKSADIGKFVLVPVEIGSMPDAIGLYQIELSITATPKGPTSFSAQPATTKQLVLCTWSTPLQPDKDDPTPASDTVSGTPRRMGKLMTFVPTGSTDVEDVIWRIYDGMTNASPPFFFNQLAVEITHNGDLKRYFDGAKIVNTGHPFRLVEQWLMWCSNTGSPPWNRGACAGHVQLLKTMCATLGINIRRKLCIPCTPQLPPASPTDPKPAPLAAGSYAVELDMKVLPGGLDSYTGAQHVKLTGPDGKLYEARIALMEPDKKGEFFEACSVTPAGKYLPGGFTTQRLVDTGVKSWAIGPSGRKTGGGFTKAQRGFDSAADVVRWWSQTTTRSGFKRFMCWVHIEAGALKYCWDVDGRPYEAADYEKIRDTGKQLPPP